MNFLSFWGAVLFFCFSGSASAQFVRPSFHNETLFTALLRMEAGVGRDTEMGFNAYVDIDEYGRITGYEIISHNHEAFAAAFENHVEEMIWSPPIQEGQPVAGRVSYEHVWPPQSMRGSGRPVGSSSDTECQYIESLGGFSCTLEEVEVAVANRKGWEKLPRDLFKMPQLTVLVIRDNAFSQVPKGMEKLSQLLFLDISGNPLPEEELTKLRELLPGCIIRMD